MSPNVHRNSEGRCPFLMDKEFKLTILDKIKKHTLQSECVFLYTILYLSLTTILTSVIIHMLHLRRLEIIYIIFLSHAFKTRCVKHADTLFFTHLFCVLSSSWVNLYNCL